MVFAFFVYGSSFIDRHIAHLQRTSQNCIYQVARVRANARAVDDAIIGYQVACKYVLMAQWSKYDGHVVNSARNLPELTTCSHRYHAIRNNEAESSAELTM